MGKEENLNSARHSFVRLITGYFDSDGLNISCVPGGYEDYVGIFPVGLPEQSELHGLHLVK